MPRPSHDIDKKLISAGRTLLPKTGVSNLKVRHAATMAGVNLGMFHYHFKNKGIFVQRILESIYEEFFQGFSLESTRQGTVQDRLRRALTVVAKFARDNRSIILPLVADSVHGEKAVIEFARNNLRRHMSILISLIREAQEKKLMSKGHPLPMLLSLLGVVVFPGLMVGILERSKTPKIWNSPVPKIREMFFSDEAIHRRVELALATLFGGRLGQQLEGGTNEK